MSEKFDVRMEIEEEPELTALGVEVSDVLNLPCKVHAEKHLVFRDGRRVYGLIRGSRYQWFGFVREVSSEEDWDESLNVSEWNKYEDSVFQADTLSEAWVALMELYLSYGNREEFFRRMKEISTSSS